MLVVMFPRTDPGHRLRDGQDPVERGAGHPRYQEFMRYYFMSVATDDAALACRVPLLALLACVVVTVAVLLRRSHIPGPEQRSGMAADRGVGVTLLLLAFTPTKWTIQFGCWLGSARRSAATATVAVVVTAARSSTRNLTVFISGLLFAMAALAGYNTWAWLPTTPRHRLVLTGPRGFLEHRPVRCGAGAGGGRRAGRLAASAPGPLSRTGASHTDSAHTGDAGDRRRLLAASSPIAVIAALILLVDVVVFAKAAITRAPAHHPVGHHRCVGRRQRSGRQSAGGDRPQCGDALTPAGGLSATGSAVGHEVRRVSPRTVSPPTCIPRARCAAPGMNVDHTVARRSSSPAAPGAGTTGGTGPKTVNGSTAALPFGLDPARPVLGSYGYRGEARLTTGWYELPAGVRCHRCWCSPPPGRLHRRRPTGAHLRPEAGGPVRKRGPAGQFEVRGRCAAHRPRPTDHEHAVAGLRIPMSRVPADATVMRLSLLDNNLGPNSSSPSGPQAPRLRTLQQVVGENTPTLIDFSAAAHFPCRRPMQVRHGVARRCPAGASCPTHRRQLQSKTWQRGADGGLLGISQATTTAQAVPTYLKDDWVRDWGALGTADPVRARPAPAAVRATDITRWGWSRTSSIEEPDTDDD